MQLVGLFAAEGGLGPLVLRGLAKIGSSQPIFDWGSFLLFPQPFETGVALILPGDRKGRPYAQICKYHPR